MYLQLVLAVLSIGHATQAWNCPTSSNVITRSEIRVAAEASEYVYEDFKVGSTIPNTNFKVTRIFENTLITRVGIKALMADDGNTRMIAYRGTNGGSQLLEQAKDTLTNDKIDLENMGDHGKYSLLRFFHQASELLFPAIQEELRSPSKKYIITGHSLGGALASVLAFRMTQKYQGSVWKNPKSCLITFGQPRTGDRAYANLHDKLISTWRKLRFVYKGDPITVLPLRFITSFTHHSRAVYIGSRRKGFLFGKRSLRLRKRIAKRIASSKTLSSRQKRSWFGSSIPYWKVCNEQEDFRCTSHLRGNYHSMSLYLKNVKDYSAEMQTRKGTVKRSFAEALIGTCRHQKKRSI